MTIGDHIEIAITRAILPHGYEIKWFHPTGDGTYELEVGPIKQSADAVPPLFGYDDYLGDGVLV